MAQRLANDALLQSPRWTPALLVAAKAASRQQRHKDAVAYYDRLADDCGAQGAKGLYQAGRILLHELHLASESELRFRRALDIDPRLAPALKELAHLLAVEGRTREAAPYNLELFRLGEVDVDHLALLGMPLGVINDPELLRKCHIADRADPAILVGLAASTTYNLPPEQKKLLLQEAVRMAPGLVDGQARLGGILLKEGNELQFSDWHDRLPSAADEHPEVWALRAAWAQKQGQTNVAMRCSWEAIKRDANHRAAIYQLGQMLLRQGRTQDAAPLLERGEQLLELQQLQDVLIHTEHTSLAPMQAVAAKLNSLGRVWEAWGWAQVALQKNPNERWAVDLSRRLASTLASDPPLTVADSSPIARLDLSDYPLPHWKPSSESQRPRGREGDSRVAFVESAQRLGIAFQYFNDSRPASKGKRMFEFPGGGVAILDYDADGWPDIYFTQGCRWPPDPKQREHLDHLYRNVGGGRFEEVAASAGVIEPSFSHGASACDFNNDGFPDVYVANIGRNRLYRNNGDGTFSDVTASIVGDAGRWTTSCLLADINGDALPDIYDVNYLQAEDVFQRICKHGDGAPRMCMPFHFPAAQDQLYLNLGDGRFADATAAAGIEVPNGKGLGIAAGDFDGSGRLSLFVANDTTPNFFFANRTQSPEAISLVECGVVMGVALNGRGRAEGCMGIAVGDANGDQRQDLFIGNFLRETNTLYLQQEHGDFIDATNASRLDEPSVDQLAFGTQFFDPDLDGDLDLIVTNGHVDDVRAYGRPYHMPPQFFENDGSGRFVEQFAETLGPFFNGAYLGRALARCDFNRDGLEDVVISHLDSPAALLTNTSTPHGASLALRLVGLESGRDAIGATVVAKVGKRRLLRQMTAGDGYQCANQRLLTFGLGNGDMVDELIIRWPSGKTTTHRGLAPNGELLCLENGRMHAAGRGRVGRRAAAVGPAMP
ncbi:MAG: VCBS repeat-containing protein [Planctomycetes bacterium]|nr:VCBS repeat-containing protein [Planctomycetota bacterium]